MKDEKGQMNISRFGNPIIWIVSAFVIILFLPILASSASNLLPTGTLDNALEIVRDAGFTVFAEGDEPTDTPTFLVCSSTASENSCTSRVDGTADDVEINAAIDNCPPKGCRVQLTNGAYNIAASIEIRNAVWLQGVGSGGGSALGGATTLRLQDGINLDVITTQDNPTKFALISNLEINGNAANNTSGKGISGAWHYSRFENLSVRNTENEAIHLEDNGLIFPDNAVDNVIAHTTVGFNINGTGILIDNTDNHLIDVRSRNIVGPAAIEINSAGNQLEAIHTINGTYGIWIKNSNNRVMNSYVEGSLEHGIVLEATGSVNHMNNQIIGNRVRGNNPNQMDQFSGIIMIGQTSPTRLMRDNVIVGNVITGDFNIGINESTNFRTGNNVITGNSLNDLTGTGPRINLDTQLISLSRVQDNVGFRTQNSGTATILNTTTSIVVSHGLAVTPVAGTCMFIGAEDPTNTPGAHWIDTFTATQMTLNVENDPGASNYDVGWTCRVD